MLWDPAGDETPFSVISYFFREACIVVHKELSSGGDVCGMAFIFPRLWISPTNEPFLKY